jgi:hypothetical protein
MQLRVRFSCPSSIIWVVLACALLLQSESQCNSATPSSIRQTPTTAFSKAIGLRYARAYETLSFEANAGQTDERVKFMARGSDYVLFLTSTEAVLKLNQLAEGNLAGPIGLKTRNREGFLMPIPDAKTGSASNHEEQSLRTAVLRIRLMGANPSPKVSGLEQQPGKGNYFISNDPARWRTGVPRYARIEYENIYPGVKLVYYGHEADLEYDFVVMPGADPGAIKLMLEGADKVAVETDEDVLATIGSQEIRLRKPLLYQEINGTRLPIPGRYVLEGGNQIAFSVGAYNASRPLIIDPVLVYSSYLGSPSEESGYAIAADADGNAYVTGYTFSAAFPTANALQPALSGATDVFVTKMNATGSALVYSTYLGGSSFDFARAIAVDPDGNAYVLGFTQSANFPTASAFQPAFGGGPQDAFVAKLNSAGSSLVYSTYLGGSSGDDGFGIAADAGGYAYVAGYTVSPNFPIMNAFQPALAGPSDAVVTKMSPTGSAVYSTYLGGASDDVAVTIAVDSSANAYIAGWTSSANFPIANALQAVLAGPRDAFVTKLDAAGSAPTYSSYLGGSADDYASGIAVDTSGSAYVAGVTQSTDFPTANPLQPTFGGVEDAFVTKIDAAGSTLVYATYIGGSGDDYFEAGGHIALDAGGNAYVAGVTNSPNFPSLNAVQPAFGGGPFDAFVTGLNATGSALAYSTYLGGSSYDFARAIGVDPDGNAYVTGLTFSTDFPIANAFQPAFVGVSDAFVVKIAGSTFTTVSSDFFLHESGATLFFDNNPPTATTAEFRDSSSLQFNGGNPWKQIGDWVAMPGSIPSGSLALLALSDLHVWLGRNVSMILRHKVVFI